ncbi:MAG TPA: 23S rRNA (adenine(2503)-C(2))-methyltransferase RlmN [Terracidiphilus sp.]
MDSARNAPVEEVAIFFRMALSAGPRLHEYRKCSMLTQAVNGKTAQFVRLDAPAPQSVSRLPLFGLDRAALAAWMEALGEPAFRGRQLAEALYHQRASNLDAITTLPKTLRQRLATEGREVGRPAIVQVFQSRDGTERYLVQGQAPPGALPDSVETVWMPEGDEGEAGDGSEAGEQSPVGEKSWNRATICVSSQVGCAVNCQFCLTAKLGLQRNLTAGEIAGQVVSVLDRHHVELGKDRVNLVFMGMGEPFLNYDNFMAAVRLLVHEVGLSPQRMTVSTSGILPGIERFAQEPPDVRPKLALSLNAPNNEIRAGIMPINRKWPIESLVDALRQVKLRSRERITFEYVLLGGVTDHSDHARQVARLVRRTGLPAKVNLIAWNPGPGIPYSMPPPAAIETFRATLAAEGISVYLRRPRGRDIYAACGQLKRTVEAAT